MLPLGEWVIFLCLGCDDKNLRWGFWNIWIQFFWLANAFSSNLNSTNLKTFLNLWDIQLWQKIGKLFWRKITFRSIEIWENVSLRLTLKYWVCNPHCWFTILLILTWGLRYYLTKEKEIQVLNSNIIKNIFWKNVRHIIHTWCLKLHFISFDLTVTSFLIARLSHKA